jgi:hypothetical protein
MLLLLVLLSMLLLLGLGHLYHEPGGGSIRDLVLIFVRQLGLMPMHRQVCMIGIVPTIIDAIRMPPAGITTDHI